MSKEIGVQQLERKIIHQREDVLIAKNKQKYRWMVNALSVMPIGLRLGYYAGRWVDDVVDGDENLPEGFTSVDHWIDSLQGSLQSVEADQIHPSDMPSPAFLFQQSILHLLPLENTQLGDNVRQEFAGFLEAMRGEYHRRSMPLVLTEQQILDRFWAGFSHAQNITLISIKANYRVPATFPSTEELMEMNPKDMPLILPIVLGKAYSQKDLEVDLRMGICNIPKSTLSKSELTLQTLIDSPKLVEENKTLQAWRLSETETVSQLAKKLRRGKFDLKTKALVGFLTTGM